jgi:hypothetical protein
VPTSEASSTIHSCLPAVLPDPPALRAALEFGHLPLHGDGLAADRLGQAQGGLRGRRHALDGVALLAGGLGHGGEHGRGLGGAGKALNAEHA